MAVKLAIHLRGGQVIYKTVKDWATKRDAVTGELIEFTWTDLDRPSQDKIGYLRVQSIDAILEVDNPVRSFRWLIATNTATGRELLRAPVVVGDVVTIRPGATPIEIRFEDLP